VTRRGGTFTHGATALGWANFFSREELATLVREKGGSK
jgi:hypothetical protein